MTKNIDRKGPSFHRHSLRKLAWGGAALVATGICAMAVAQTLPESAASILGMDAASLARMTASYQRTASIPSPQDNPTTEAKVNLGKKLFFDPRLSGSGAISCASCHNPSFGWQDALPTAVGDHGGVLGRHTPTILNTAWAEPLFWDGRADTLEQQATGPMLANAEMAGSKDKVVATISTVPEYRDGMAKLFPKDPYTIENVAKLLAAYERTIVSGEAPFDRWIKGDVNAISDGAKRGFVLFNTKGNCASCHSSWRFTDDGFHDIGLPGSDIGRAKIMSTLPIFDHAFKTPTLRNIAERAPYMHDGSVKTLEAVVDHYDHGFIQRASLSDQVKPLHLTAQDRADLVEFMKALTSKDSAVSVPVLPR